MLRVLVSSAVMLCVSSPCHAQTSAALTAAEILQRADAAIAKPGNFHIEAVEDQVLSADLHQDTTRIYRTAVHGADGRYRIETRSWLGSWLQVSDGANEQIVLLERSEYMRRPVAGTQPYRFQLIFSGSNELDGAWNTLIFLERDLADSRELTRLPDETLSLAGELVPCFVIHSARGSHDTAESSREETLWIDERTGLVRKEMRQQLTSWTESHIPFHRKTTTTYPLMKLDVVSPPSEFIYAPPATFKQVKDLTPVWFHPEPKAASKPTASNQLRDVIFTDAGGKKIPLSSFAGHPVLIDLWATWCGPCLISMPGFAALADRYRHGGLIVISVDEDKTADEATAYLKLHGYTWQNFHGDSTLLKQLNSNGIPHTLLLDSQGKVVLEQTGGDAAELNTALTKLLPAGAAH